MKRLLRVLMPVEWVLVGFGLLLISLYHSFGLSMPGQPGQAGNKGPVLFYFKQFLTCLDLYAAVLLVFVAGKVTLFARANWEKLKDAEWRPFWQALAERFMLPELFQDVRFFHAVLLMFIEFALFKHLIPYVHPGTYDEQFIWVDQLLCGGSICSLAVQQVIGLQSLGAISKHYHWYYPYMSLVAFLFIAVAPRKLAQEYLCAFVLIFLVGVVWIYALPTWGPVYARPELFRWMEGSEIWGLQMSLWEMKAHLDKNPGSREAIFMISGFPSLHVAVTLLGSVYLKKINSYLSLVSWSFTILVVNATIYLGWHYLLDDVGSIALVVCCTWIAKRFSWQWRCSEKEPWLQAASHFEPGSCGKEMAGPL